MIQLQDLCYAIFMQGVKSTNVSHLEMLSSLLVFNPAITQPLRSIVRYFLMITKNNPTNSRPWWYTDDLTFLFNPAYSKSFEKRKSSFLALSSGTVDLLRFQV